MTFKQRLDLYNKDLDKAFKKFQKDFPNADPMTWKYSGFATWSAGYRAGKRATAGKTSAHSEEK